MIDMSRGTQIAEQQVKSKIAFLETNLLQPFLKDLGNLGRTEQAERLSEQLAGELKLYECVLLSSAKGRSLSAIARAEGITERTVQRWVREGGLPAGLANRSQLNRKTREKQIEIPRRTSSEFAYFLGVFSAYTRPGTAQYHIRPRVAAESIAQRISAGFAVAVSSGAAIHKPKEGDAKTPFEVHCLHLRLSRHCNVITKTNTRVPWEHIQSEEEHTGFLRGFFDILGSFNMNEPGSFAVQKLHGERLLVEVAQVMSSVGIVPRIKTGTRATLFVNEKRSLQRMHELELLLEDGPREKLKEIAFRPVTRASYTAEQYYRAKALWELQPELNNSEVSKVVNIPADQIRSWRTRGKRPNEIERLEELERVAPLAPEQHQMITRLFRSFGLPSEISRRIVTEFSIEVIKEKLFLVECNQIDLRDAPELLYTLLSNDSGVERVTPREEVQAVPDAGDLNFDEKQKLVIEEVRKRIETEDLSRHPYLEPLLELCKRSGEFSFPAYTYEKFVGDLSETERPNARLALIALSPDWVCKVYWDHLLEEELVPEGFDN
jgi:transposase-like protein